MKKIIIGENTYSSDMLDEEGRANLASSQFVDAKIKETSNLMAALIVSKNAYIQELKNEIIKSKTGFLTD
ncbi:hypothetical protein N9J96_07515 [Paracoccaceae bacterium]|jgi:hypothetical protein|nr:hypothetical protein [Paracoccaceae bacterium]